MMREARTMLAVAVVLAAVHACAAVEVIGLDLAETNDPAGLLQAWHLSGGARINTKDPHLLRLSTPIRGASGALWSKKRADLSKFELVFKVRVTGAHAGESGGGMVAWYVGDQVPQEGQLYGFKDSFTGIGVVLHAKAVGDSSDILPHITLIANDGTKSFDHAMDGANLEIGDCVAPYRTGKVTTIRVHVDDDDVQVTSDASGTDVVCFTAHDKVNLEPLKYALGFTALTGPLAETWDVQSVSLMDSNPATPPPKRKPKGIGAAGGVRGEQERMLRELGETTANLHELLVETKNDLLKPTRVQIQNLIADVRKVDESSNTLLQESGAFVRELETVKSALQGKMGQNHAEVTRIQRETKAEVMQLREFIAQRQNEQIDALLKKLEERGVAAGGAGGAAASTEAGTDTDSSSSGGSAGGDGDGGSGVWMWIALAELVGLGALLYKQQKKPKRDPWKLP